MERGVWLDPWGHPHTDVTVPLACGGVSEADTTWPAPGASPGPQASQEAWIVLLLAGERSETQIRKKHFCPIPAVDLLLRPSCKTGFWRVRPGILKNPPWIFHRQSEPPLRSVWAPVPAVRELGRNYCFLCLIVPESAASCIFQMFLDTRVSGLRHSSLIFSLSTARYCLTVLFCFH